MSPPPVLRPRSTVAAALPMGGRKPFALADEAAWIHTRLAEKPDITGRELLAELNRRGVEVSYYGVWHFLDHAGLSFKKRACVPVSKIAPMSPGGVATSQTLASRGTSVPCWSAALCWPQP